MLAKSIVILCILVTLAKNIHGDFRDKADAEDFRIVSRICAPPNNTALCAAQSSRCFIRQKFNIKGAFCYLKDSVAGVLDYYKLWIQETYNGSDPCNATSYNQYQPGRGGGDHSGEVHQDRPGQGRPGQGRPGQGRPDRPDRDRNHGRSRKNFGHDHDDFGIENYNRRVNISSFSDYLKAKSPDVWAKFECAIGQDAGLFDSTGTAIGTAWRNLILNKSDGRAQTALYTAIDKCVTSEGTTCNIESFTYCAVYQCYLSVTAPVG